MIKLNLPDFCQNCPEFEPDIDRCLSMMDYIVYRLKEMEKNDAEN